MSVGIRLAIGTLTIVPVGNIHPLPPGAARIAMSVAPLAAAPVGIAAGITLWISVLLGLPPLVVGALTLAAVGISTRAMHLDGFADTVDGLGGGWTRERALEIMHRGDVGPMGVAGLVLLLVVQAGSLAQLAYLPWSGLLVAVLVCGSRLAATLVCSTPIPSARDSGMGAVVARSVPVPVAVAVTLVIGAVVSAITALSGLSWWSGSAAVGAAIVGIAGFAVLAVRRFGGVSGDVMGAAIEVAFTILLVALTVAAG